MAQPGRRGRPGLSANEKSAEVHVKMPPRLYDRAYAVATKQRTSVPELVRRSLERTLPDDQSS